MYVDPNSVVSPKNKVSHVKVLFDRGPVDYSWSVAKLTYGGNECIGIRWNGDSKESKKGVPLANAHPVWFILPKEIASVIEEKVGELNGDREAKLLDGSGVTERQLLSSRSFERSSSMRSFAITAPPR